jgi:hypothetical protein
MLDTQKAIVDVDIGEKIDVLLQTQ